MICAICGQKGNELEWIQSNDQVICKPCFYKLRLNKLVNSYMLKIIHNQFENNQQDKAEYELTINKIRMKLNLEPVEFDVVDYIKLAY